MSLIPSIRCPAGPSVRSLAIAAAACLAAVALTAPPADAQQEQNEQGQQQRQQVQNQQREQSGDRAQQSQQQSVNPLYEHWSQFQPGAYSTWETQTRVTGLFYDRRTTLTLKEINDERAVVEATIEASGPGGESGPSTRMIEVPAQISRQGDRGTSASGTGVAVPGVAPRNVEQSSSTETITTPAGEFEAHKSTTSIDQGMEELRATVYLSDQVPGRLVMSEITSDGLVENQQTTRLVASSAGEGGRRDVTDRSRQASDRQDGSGNQPAQDGDQGDSN